jgi:hypothetical protein
MVPLEELIARDYFERNGFFLKRIHLPPQPEGRKTKNPIPTPPTYLLQRETGRTKNEALADRFQLFSSDVSGLALATLTLIPWHGSGLDMPIFQSPTRYRSWIRNTIAPALQYTQQELQKIPVPATPLPMALLPGIPAQDPQRGESIELLRGAGIAAAFTVRTLLESLIHQVEAKPDAPETAITEILRTLKAYGLISPPQLDLFQDL